jgi:PiT family inorganic phosphate transporter
MHQSILLALVVVTALGFDFTNGFHDTANAMATSIATGALKPKVAVGVSAVLNLVGAFLSLAVAATIASGIVDQNLITLQVVFAGLVGGIVWNMLTWYLGIPSSSSHALIGGVVGAMFVHAGSSAIEWNGVFSKVVIPALLAPFVAGSIAAAATWLAYRLTQSVKAGVKSSSFRWAQVGSASMVSLAHGTNDAQKTMGIITLALVANGTLGKGGVTPTWVIIACAIAISLGTYLGGWRIIRTLGKGLTDIETPQGFAAETSSAAVLLASSHFGIPLSTTQICTGSVVGSGVGHSVPVRWRVFGRMAFTWALTLPAAALVGAASFAGQQAIGGNAGIIVLTIILVGVCGGIYTLSRKNAVSANNVNDDWDSSSTPLPSVPAT